MPYIMELIGRKLKSMLKEKNKFEITFLLPCLNEEKTLGLVIDSIKELIKKENYNAEILVVDNGSSDDSSKIAIEKGARVVYEEQQGYGSALRRGFKEALGTYIIMGDADTTYDFFDASSFINYLRDGYKFVIGNRFSDIEKGAMSYLHFYGVRFLSFIGRFRYKTFIYDFHCGLRGINREFISNIEFNSSGMEFATEMIDKICRKTDKIKEVPIKLKKCVVDRKPHLKTFRDGFRHLKYIILN